MFALASGVAAASAVALIDGPAGVGVSMSIILFAMVVLSGAFPPGSKGRDLGDPAFLAGSVFFLSFGLRGFVVVANLLPDLGPGSDLPGHRDVHLNRCAGDLPCSPGWLAFLIAYRLPFGEAIGRRLPDLQLERSRTDVALLLSVVLGGVGWASRALLCTATACVRDRRCPLADATQTLLVWLTGFTAVALALAFVRLAYFPRTPGVVLWAGALLSLELGVGLATGSRTQVAGSIITPMAVLALSGHFRFSRSWLVLVPVAIAMFGFTYVYRALPDTPARDLGGIVVRLGHAVDAAVELGPVGLTQAGFENVSNRYHGLDSVREILDLSTTSTTWGGHYLAAVPAAVVPRFLWADKPYDSEGQDFARDYFGVAPDANVSFTATWIGDLLRERAGAIHALGHGGIGWAVSDAQSVRVCSRQHTPRLCTPLCGDFAGRDPIGRMDLLNDMAGHPGVPCRRHHGDCHCARIASQRCSSENGWSLGLTGASDGEEANDRHVESAKAVTGLLALVLGKSPANAVNFLVAIALARLVNPTDQGTYGLTLFWVVLGSTLLEFGVNEALLFGRIDPDAIATHATIWVATSGLLIAVGILVGLVLPASSEVRGLFPVIAAAQAAALIYTTPKIIMEYEQRVPILVAVELAGVCAGAAAALLIAHMNGGAWALAGQLVVANGLIMIFGLVAARTRYLLRAHRSRVMQSLRHFGVPLWLGTTADATAHPRPADRSSTRRARCSRGVLESDDARDDIRAPGLRCDDPARGPTIRASSTRPRRPCGSVRVSPVGQGQTDPARIPAGHPHRPDLVRSSPGR